MIRVTDESGATTARYYSPELMRFINQDIVVGDISNSTSLSRYSYVNGNPVTNIDPFGLEAIRALKAVVSVLYKNAKTEVGTVLAAGGLYLSIKSKVNYASYNVLSGISNKLVARADLVRNRTYTGGLYELPVVGGLYCTEASALGVIEAEIYDGLATYSYSRAWRAEARAFVNSELGNISGCLANHLAGEQFEEISDQIKQSGVKQIVIDAYSNLTKVINGQAHHLNQNAVFKSIIPKAKGLCVELYGNAFTDVGSPHYEAHRIMEEFWDQYRDGGEFEKQIPSIGDYNRALYDSLVGSGVYSLEDVVAAVRAAYEQQYSYGLRNSDDVPRIPGKLYQAK